jgi:hypothetical protein
MRKFRKWHDYLIERLAADKEEAIGYLDVALEEYQEDGDTAFFLKGVRNVVEAQGRDFRVCQANRYFRACQANSHVSRCLAEDSFK